jgi:hypothetical protein
MKKLITFLAVLGLTVSAFAAAHPKLIEAQKLLVLATEKVQAAEAANEFDLGGWARKAQMAIAEARHQVALATKAVDGHYEGSVAALPSESPEVDVFFRKHPRLAEAQQYVNEAYQLISQAQRDNGFDMEGHAQKAKDLLDVANADIRKAAQAH